MSSISDTERNNRRFLHLLNGLSLLVLLVFDISSFYVGNQLSNEKFVVKVGNHLFFVPH